MFPVTYVIDDNRICNPQREVYFSADFELLEVLLNKSKYASCNKTVEVLLRDKKVSPDFQKRLAIAIYYDQFIKPDEVAIIVHNDEEYDIANHYFGDDSIIYAAKE